MRRRLRRCAAPDPSQLPDGDQLIGRGIGQRPEERRIDDAEDRGVDADAEGQRRHSGGGEAWRLREEPQRIPQVLQQRLHAAEATAVANGFPRLFDTADRAPRLAMGLGRRQSAAERILLEHFEMRAQFVVELAVDPAAPELFDKPREELAGLSRQSPEAAADLPRRSTGGAAAGHSGCSDGLRKRLTTVETRSQRAASAARAF